MTDKWTPEEWKEYVRTGKKPSEERKETSKGLSPKSNTLPSKEEKVQIGRPQIASGILFEEDRIYTKELKLLIHGFPYDKNPQGNPYQKQSDRNMVQRNKNGDVFTFRNSKTGKLDVIQRHYQPAIVTKTTEDYVRQILTQLDNDWEPFSEEVLIAKCIFMFAPLKSFSKKKLGLVMSGHEIPKTTKPDMDNLFKLLGDALEKANVYTNDSLIWNKDNMKKVYGKVPCIIVHLKGN